MAARVPPPHHRHHQQGVRVRVPGGTLAARRQLRSSNFPIPRSYSTLFIALRVPTSLKLGLQRTSGGFLHICICTPTYPFRSLSSLKCYQHEHRRHPLASLLQQNSTLYSNFTQAKSQNNSLQPRTMHNF